jgi:O-antigen ligase/Flp pilus assembly protein TadD
MNLKNILRYVCLAGIFIIPFASLVVANSLFFPFITGKNFYFRIIVEVIFGAWLILAFTDAAYRPKKSWMVWGLGLFVLVMAIADAVSINPFKSFWSNYERMEGWVTLAHLLVYFLIAGTVLTRDLWDRFLQTWLGVSLVTILYSIVQVAGLIRINQGGVRTDATFGNAAYFAIFAIFTAFISLLFVTRKKGEMNLAKNLFLFFGFNAGLIIFILPSLGSTAAATTGAGAVYGWMIAGLLLTNVLIILSTIYEEGRILYGLMFIGNAIVVYNTQTRGAILGFIGGLVLAGLLVAFFERRIRWLRIGALTVVVVAVLTVVGFFAIKNTSFVKNSQTLSRFSSISLNDKTTESRFILWNMALEGFRERPILGWGQESFNYIFNKYYDPRLYDQEQWFDRAHNVFFDWLTAGGILGLGTYLFFFGSIIWYIWKGKDDNLSISERSLLTGLLAGYFVHNFFVFDNLISYVLYVSIAAYVYGRRTHLTENIAHRYYENRLVPWFGLAVAIALIYFVNIPAIQANTSLIAALNAKSGDPLVNIKKSLSYNSFGRYEAREQLISLTQQLAEQFDQIQAPTESDNKIKQGYLDAFDAETIKQIAETPQDARYYMLPGATYNRLGESDKALPLLQKAAELSPKKQTILFELASAYIAKGDAASAQKTLKTTFELDESYELARILYATAAIYNKDFPTATDVLKPLPLLTVASSDQILHALYYAGQYNQLIDLWKVRVQNAPTDVNSRISLAAAYLLIKDKTNAIAQINKAIELDQNFKSQGDEYIKAIKSGQL